MQKNILNTQYGSVSITISHFIRVVLLTTIILSGYTLAAAADEVRISHFRVMTAEPNNFNCY